ncbi:MAG TPA: BolA family transcriptional regulator [Bdellovibrionales bacterium]|nr:BolA family transcriptional regulator [Pseudobdellovibrionaceae bacterium]HAG91745.1 BolA family transcriptional regulator [Bdellovibrionales bacterium]|tara:strand:+ start:2694 stop:3005 length:312 start_codon:yes stop_codon:yes gene_type:complete
MKRDARLFQSLQQLKPVELIIENESHLHGFSRGEDSHYKVLVVSKEFEGLSRVERHQKVNALLKEEFDQGLHALTLRALTESEFSKMDAKDFQSPQCAHQSES